MSIVRMKRLQVIVPHDETRQLLRELTRAGCLEIERNDEWMSDPELSKILKRSEGGGTYAREFNEVSQALESLKKYAGVKKGLFEPRQQVTEEALVTQRPGDAVMATANAINQAAKQLYSISSEKSRLDGQKTGLLPWQTMDVPLDYETGGQFVVRFGTIPAVLNFAEIKAEIEKDDAPAELELISSDKECHYTMLTAHRDAELEAVEALKAYGFSDTVFKGLAGTAAECIEKIDKEIVDLGEEEIALQENIKSYSDSFWNLGRAYDYMAAQAQWDDVSAALPGTEKTAFLSGWMPEECMDKVSEIMEAHGAAYEFTDPEEGDSVPTALKNGKFVTPFGQVTNLYGMPAYDSIIDPNPIVAISYFIFFGLMFSDAAYGLLLFFACLYFLKKARPGGGMKTFVTMFMLCGISVVAWGAIFGSWFGDFVTVVTERITGTAWAMPALLDPLAQPIVMLGMSLGFGIIHLYIGMILNIKRQAVRKEWMDIVFDELTWMLFIPCVVLFALTSNSVYLIVAGACLALVLVTGGRKNKGLGKVTGGLGALYNGLTGNLSDILSYSRLMALAMATGVVAQVMNTLGNMGGTSVFGWIFFAIIFCIGQVFNFAISILGAFVHSCRLQFVELFGRFYEGGGREFKPLAYKTKYTEIVEEK